MHAWIYFRLLYSVPLTHVSVFMSVTRCFNYCSFITYSEIREHVAFSFVLLLKIVLAVWDLLWFHADFRIVCSVCK